MCNREFHPLKFLNSSNMSFSKQQSPQLCQEISLVVKRLTIFTGGIKESTVHFVLLIPLAGVLEYIVNISTG